MHSYLTCYLLFSRFCLNVVWGATRLFFAAADPRKKQQRRFRWITSSNPTSGAFEASADKVEKALKDGGGPYFLGEKRREGEKRGGQTACCRYTTEGRLEGVVFAQALLLVSC